MEENYKAFGHREFEPFMDGTQEYNQYLIPRLNQNFPEIKDGYLATVVCADVWNSEATDYVDYLYPDYEAFGDVFVF